MNKIWISLWILLVGISACSEEELIGYNSDCYIYFKKESKDSTVFSFAYDRTATQAIINLQLDIIGIIGDQDKAYTIHFLPEESSAQPDKHLLLPKVMQQIKASDTTGFLSIIVLNQYLDQGAVTAVFELRESFDFKVGLHNNIKARVIITNQLSRPQWWNGWHEGNGLGTYSGEKYQAFIDEMKIFDLTLMEDGGNISYSEMRALLLQFKRILAETPRYELDGSIMKVAIKG